MIKTALGWWYSSINSNDKFWALPGIFGFNIEVGFNYRGSVNNLLTNTLISNGLLSTGCGYTRFIIWTVDLCMVIDWSLQQKYISWCYIWNSGWLYLSVVQCISLLPVNLRQNHMTLHIMPSIYTANAWHNTSPKRKISVLSVFVLSHALSFS